MELGIIRSGGSKGGREGRTPPPLHPNSFNFMQFLGELHGAGDHSGKWEKLGTMHLMAAMGHRIVAVDLPGLYT